MKGIKKFSLGSLCLLLSLGVVFLLLSSSVFAEKSLVTSLKHAVQHIGKVDIIKDNSSASASIVPENSRVKINADNFVISRKGIISGNTIEGTSTTSSILGGGNNVISSSENSTVVAGRENTVNAATSTIGGGKGNQIKRGSDGSVIIGGNNNSISSGRASSVVGGYKNKIEGEYSAVAGKNNQVIGDYSVALGSGSKVFANNSFLWSDGSSESMLKTDDVFVIMSQNGMIVNGSESLSGVQLTISGSLIVGQNNENDVNIECGGIEGEKKGAGSIKLVDKHETQKCLCICDGKSWNSLLGNGQCQTICDGSSSTDTVNPKCGTGLTSFMGDDGKINFLGTCLQGKPVDGSYYMINGTNSTGRIYWACQGTNGTTQACSYKVSCLGDIPSHAHRNNTIVPNVDREYYYKQNDNNQVVCSFSCDDGYLWTGGNNGYCQQICNYDSESCFVGTIEYPAAGWTNDYYYNCNYVYRGNNNHYSCKKNCGANQVWAGAISGCVNKDLACNEGTPKYTCNLGILDEGSKGMTVENFVWNCIDSRGSIIKQCSTPKPIIEKDVYYNTSKAGLIETAWFSISGSIATGIRIVLPYEANGENSSTQFMIQANQERSVRETYNSTNGNITLKWPYLVNDKLPVGEVLYKLKIVNGEMNLCAGSCSVAGQCLYGATTSNFNSALNGNTAIFTWKCSNGTKTDSCSATCNVNTSSCTSKPSNASDCDPVSDSGCTPLAGGTVNLNDFYMYNASEIISTSSCGKKRHCVKSGSYIDYSITDNYCTQTGFKCNDGYVLEGCSCNNICNIITNPGTCRGGLSLEYSSATRKTGYTYTCGGTYTCNAACPGGKVRNGSSCVDKPSVCGGTHYNCTGGSNRTDYSHDELNHIYLWKCKLGSETTQCRECDSGYKLEGTECVADTLSCDGSLVEGYVVSSLEHGGTESVEKDDNSNHCTAMATCNNGEIVISGEDCSGVCKSGNPGTCNFGLTANNYTGSMYGYNYKYSCGGGYGDCNAICLQNTIWNGTKCAPVSSICNNSATNPGTAGCSVGYYSQVSSGAAGWVWNCKDANNSNLNSSVCHKCKNGYSWDSSSNKCMNSIEIKVSCKRTRTSNATNWDIGPGFEVEHLIEFEFDKNAPKDIDLYISNEVERSGGSDSDGKTIIISSGGKKGSDTITSHDDNCNHDSYYWLHTNFSRSVPDSVTVGNTVYTFKKGTTDTCEGDVSYDGMYEEYCGYEDGIIGEDLCESPYFETLGECNGNKPDGEYKCISSGDDDCPYTYTKKSSCLSPCGGGNIESGKTKKCYLATYVNCPATCSFQERTCNDGLWDGGGFGLSYTKGACTLNGKTCNTSTYPLSSCPDHGNCSECVNYTADGNSSCNKGATGYKLNSCDSGYTKSGNSCITECTGTGPSSSSHTVSNNNSTPSINTDWHYSTNTNEACSYSCADGYYRIPSCTTSGLEECRQFDHYERRFFRNGEEITEYVQTFHNGWDQKFGVFISTIKLSNEIKKSGNWHHNNCWNTSGVGLNKLSSFRGSFYKPSSTEGKITTDLTKFYTDGIPVVSSLPQGYVSYDRQGFSCEELNYVFNGSSQPSVSKYKADNYKGQTINLYIGGIFGGVSEGCNGDCGWDVWPFTKNDRYANLFFYSDAYASDYYIVQAVSVPMLCPATTTSSPSYGGGGGGGGGCFISGTRVKMADGSEKNIEDVVVGDELLGQGGVNVVEELYRPLLGDKGLYSINGSKNFVSPEHPFMTTEGWKSFNPELSTKLIGENVEMLRLGDVLLKEDGYEILKSYGGVSADIDTQLYNFKVGGDNTYYANGYLVHNKTMMEQTDNFDAGDCRGLYNDMQTRVGTICGNGENALVMMY